MFYDEQRGVFRDYSVPAPYVPKPHPRAQMSAAYQTIKTLIDGDEGLKADFAEWLMLDGIEPKKRLTAPMPIDPAAIQVSIWDNWLGDTPRKSKPHRYGVTIKVWNDARIDFKSGKAVTWTGTATLMDPAALAAAAAKAHAKKGNTYPISERYAEMLAGACEVMTAEEMKGGMLVTRPPGEGTLRHECQMVMADAVSIERGELGAGLVIWVNADTPIKMPGFSDMDAAGKPLGSRVDDRTGEITSRCIMQSRYSRDPDVLARWVTS